MSNKNIHVNPNFYSHSQPKIHINPSFVKKVGNFSERGIDTGVNEVRLNTGYQNHLPSISTKPSRNLAYNLEANQSYYINEQPLVPDAFKFVRNPDGIQSTLTNNQSTMICRANNYLLNNSDSFHAVSQNNDIFNSLLPNTGTVSRCTFPNSKLRNSSRTVSAKSTLKNNLNKQLSLSEKRNFSVNHSFRYEKTSRNIGEIECAKKNSSSPCKRVNTVSSINNFNHISSGVTICNNRVPQSADNTTSNIGVDVKPVHSKILNRSFTNQNIPPTSEDILCKQSHLKTMESKRDSVLLQSCAYSPQTTIFKSRLKLIRRNTIRKSAKYIREDLLAKKRKYAVKTKTKLVRRNSASYKSSKGITPKLSKLRRSLTLRKGSLLRAKEKVVFNQVSKPRTTVFSKQNKFNRSGSLISKFKIRKGFYSKPKFSSPPSEKYAWSRSLKRGPVKKLSDKFININGNLYKSTATSLKKQDLSPKPKKKHRLISSKYFSKRFLNSSRNSKLVYRRQSSNTKLESGTLIEIVRRKKLARFKRVNDFCFFYNKYGKCKKENKGCPFIHDPSRVAICTRFLQGTCSNADCPFSHKLDKNKMPVCSHFLEGLCSREECPYRHVRVNPGAPICVDFLKGHCPKGEECKNKHILICEDFKSNGKCPRGKKCPLSHRKAPVSESSKNSKKSSDGSEKSKKNRTCTFGVLGLANRGENTGCKAKGSTVGNRYFDDCIDMEDISEPDEISTNVSSTLDITRKRIFEKLDKIKRNYNVGSDNVEEGFLDSQSKETGESSVEETKSKVSHENQTQTSVPISRFPPLPKILPSFIPLEMPVCSEPV